jgi:sialidase-1
MCNRQTLTVTLAFSALISLHAMVGAANTEAEPEGAGEAPSEPTKVFGGARIPTLLLTKQGTLLAFCSVGDNARGSAYVRRSADLGKTWGKQIRISPDGRKINSQFASVSVTYDRKTEKIRCFFNKGTDRWNAKKPPILFTFSEDDGRTWKEPVRPYDSERFDKDLPPLRSVQGQGIQLSSGRLLAPCYRIDQRGAVYLYSDDGGKHWKLTGKVPGRTSVEFCALELADGTVYMNGRIRDGHRGPARWVARSKDGGLTWSAAEYERQLPGAPCHAGLVRLTDARRHDKSRILFSLPAKGSPQKRLDLKIWLSYDECKTWKLENSRILVPGSVAYSDLAVLPDLSVGCLYESNKPWHSIWYRRFTLEWLTDGKDRIDAKK